MQMNGWVLIHKKITEWQWYRESETLHLFLHLLVMANFKDKEWRGITIKRGQLVTGRKSLARETGLSERQIRTSLNRLKSTSELTIKSTNRYSIITIQNYDEYQSELQDSDQQIDQPNANKRPASDHDLKNIKKKKENNTFSFLKNLIEKGVVEQVAKDWLEVRRRKKASNTETAFKGLETQIVKSGLDWNEAITIAVTHSWAGFNADWVTNKPELPPIAEQNKEIQDRIAKTLQQRGIA